MNYEDPIFKVPSIPTKRKAPPDPTSVYKASKHQRLDDIPPPEEKDDAQPSQQDLEQEENEEDEEGGRFYGSGISSKDKEILSYLDREDAFAEEGGEVIGREGFGEREIRKLAASLEKAIQFNEARRSKFPNDPTKYYP
jgi:beta-catenin-like protein 1